MNNLEERLEELKPILKFFIHIIVGTIIFILIAGAAVGVHYVVKGLESLELPSLIIDVFRAMEYFVFGADVIGYVMFIIRSTWRLIEGLWKH